MAAMTLMEVHGEQLEVGAIYDFARGLDGTCAFCQGDPCNEAKSIDTPISRFYAKNTHAETCPVCDGRPT